MDKKRFKCGLCVGEPISWSNLKLHLTLHHNVSTSSIEKLEAAQGSVEYFSNTVEIMIVPQTVNNAHEPTRRAVSLDEASLGKFLNGMHVLVHNALPLLDSIKNAGVRAYASGDDNLIARCSDPMIKNEKNDNSRQIGAPCHAQARDETIAFISHDSDPENEVISPGGQKYAFVPCEGGEKLVRKNFSISMNPSNTTQYPVQSTGGRDGRPNFTISMNPSTSVQSSTQGEPDGRTTSSKPTENNQGKPANMTEALSDLLNVVNRSYEVIHERMSSISDSIEQRQNQVASKDEVMSDKPIQKRRRSSSEKLP